MNVTALTRNAADDSLPATTSLGSYPIVYFTDTGDMLCPECATEELDEACSADDRPIPYFGPQWSDILYEGIEWCTACNIAVRGAYHVFEEDE